MKARIICTTVLVEKSPQALPLGAACIASAIKSNPLTKSDCQVELLSFFPEDSEQKIFDNLIEYTKDSSCNQTIFCFSVFVWNRLIIETIARKLRGEGFVCIAGGPEVTANPESFTDFDYLVSGPGEEKVPSLIADILGIDKSLKTSPTSNDSEKLSFTSPYLDGTLDSTRFGGVLWELARGCPFKCSYCYESKGEKKIQRFPMERISAELDLFAKQKIPQVFVLDPTYNANKQQALELLKLISQKTPDTFYYFEARAEFIDQQLANAFTKLPCALQIGLQSSDENVLRLVNRPFNRKQFLKGINCLNQAGVIFGLDLIYGLPGDTINGFCQSVDFAIAQYPNNLEIFCLSVLPGTDLADKASELQLTYESQAPYHILYTNKFSEKDLLRAKKIAAACSYFYNDGRAVPWFNSVLKVLRIRASQFFEQFPQEDIQSSDGNCNHKLIEEKQICYISKLLKEKHQDKYTRLISDIIRLNGAISRTQDTGKTEKITLTYPAEYLDSQYATDLQFFLANVKPKQNIVSTFRQNNQTYWK